MASISEMLRQGRNDILAGSAGGMTCKVFEYPLDTVKVQMQTAGGTELAGLGAVSLLRHNMRVHGFLRLYHGIASPLAGSMAENAMLFVSFGLAQRLMHDGPKETMSVPQTVAASLFAGVAVSTVLTPVELVKCRMQTLSEGAVRYKSTADCLVRTLREEGLMHGLYRGHTSMLARECPGNVAWFGGYEIGCWALTPKDGRRSDLPPWAVCMSGALAGMLYWGVPFPADVVKSKIQTGTHGLPAGVEPTIARVFQHTLQEEGVRGLYRGCGITVTRAAPGNGTRSRGRARPSSCPLMSVPLRSSAFRVVRDGDAGARGQTAARRARVATRVARPTAAPANGANIG